MIKHGADPNRLLTVNDGGWVNPGEWPLMFALREQDFDAVRALLDAGADVKYQTLQGESALTAAMPTVGNKRGEETVILLLKRGAQFGGKGGESLESAIDSPAVTRLLLEQGADPNADGKYGKPLAACGERIIIIESVKREMANIIESCKLMISHGGDLEGAIASFQGKVNKIRSETPEDEWTATHLETKAALLRDNFSEFARNHQRDLKRPGLERAEMAGDASLSKGDRGDAVLRYTEALQAASSGGDDDRRLRGKAIQAALGMTPQPGLPEEADRHIQRAEAFVKKATGLEDFKSARKELHAAAPLAPWKARIYYNLGLIEEKLQDFQASTASFNLYLLAAPDSPDSAAVRKKLINLEVDSERIKR